MISLGIDLGGTNVKGVLVTDAGEILAQETNAIQHFDWKRSVAELIQRITRKAEGQEFELGLAAPGLPDETNRQINFMPGRLEGLEHFYWSDFNQGYMKNPHIERFWSHDVYISPLEMVGDKPGEDRKSVV